MTGRFWGFLSLFRDCVALLLLDLCLNRQMKENEKP